MLKLLCVLCVFVLAINTALADCGCKINNYNLKSDETDILALTPDAKGNIFMVTSTAKKDCRLVLFDVASSTRTKELIVSGLLPYEQIITFIDTSADMLNEPASSQRMYLLTERRIIYVYPETFNYTLGPTFANSEQDQAKWAVFDPFNSNVYVTTDTTLYIVDSEALYVKSNISNLVHPAKMFFDFNSRVLYVETENSFPGESKLFKTFLVPNMIPQADVSFPQEFEDYDITTLQTNQFSQTGVMALDNDEVWLLSFQKGEFLANVTLGKDHLHKFTSSYLNVAAGRLVLTSMAGELYALTGVFAPSAPSIGLQCNQTILPPHSAARYTLHYNFANQRYYLGSWKALLELVCPF